ncbi:hypothetical protein L226DRAFT_615142 [Lentinus tigrinus ALCF2SS1-7]|uniref:Uncharacterized protein n=1 Tax=Lentinus tigrinus ALCF2SS1-6 TaxID=1328759 RepID=A0A5C2S2J8_9APHY|nr:hypothetical protein L227DRAFT_655335 [Lentinus tigrinus ALCF2SS1-6]RPD71845.1 hypothetical protein L226DRAFT_615142 [Lentinus tigrinus ALCF2SS1-7]
MVTTSPRTTSFTRPRAKRAMKISVQPGPATCGYGFIIDHDCLRRWAKIIYGELFGPDSLSSMPAEEAEITIQAAYSTTASMIPLKVYKGFPRIPRLRRRLALMNPAQRRYLLVLQDNSSQAALSAAITSEDLDGVRRMLGLGGQKPRWYHLPEW